MRKAIFLWAGLFSLLFFAEVNVFACDCILIEGLTVKQEVKRNKDRARLVFAGEVIEVSKDGSVTKLRVEK